MRTYASLRLFVGCVVAVWSQHALATFHEWKIDQVYSNASGSVQYVDFVLHLPTDDEMFLAGQHLTAGLNGHSLTFANLPSQPVDGQHFLVATPGFAAFAGVTPDYTFPAAGPFFNQNGDTLTYAGGFDSFTFPALPVDGIHALNRNNSISINAPVNFSGQTGFVPEPASWVMLSIGVVGLGVAFRRRLAIRRADLASR